MKRILILTSTLIGLAALTACDTEQVVQVVRAVNVAAVPCEGTGTCPTTPPPSTTPPTSPEGEGCNEGGAPVNCPEPTGTVYVCRPGVPEGGELRCG